jgi:hypothetical protein
MTSNSGGRLAAAMLVWQEYSVVHNIDPVRKSVISVTLHDDVLPRYARRHFFTMQQRNMYCRIKVKSGLKALMPASKVSFVVSFGVIHQTLCTGLIGRQVATRYANSLLLFSSADV